MTIQQEDSFVLGDRTYAIIGQAGQGAFTPADLGIDKTGTMECSACWRGYLLQYKIMDNSLVLDKLDSAVSPEVLEPLNGVEPVESSFLASTYNDLKLECKFTGNLLVAAGLVSGLQHVPFFPGALEHEEILLIAFENGKKVSCTDVTPKIHAYRKQLASKGGTDRQEVTSAIHGWVRDALGVELIDYMML